MREALQRLLWREVGEYALRPPLGAVAPHFLIIEFAQS
jgi:hypothetical protein